MPGQLIDPEIDELDDGGVEVTNRSPAPTQVASTDTLPPDDDSIPQQFRGRSAADLLKIIRDQEAYIGRQGHELGTLRRLADNAVSLATQGRPAPGKVETEEALDANALLDNPTDAVSRVARKTIQPLEDRLASIEWQGRQEAFIRAHPTAQTDVADPAFVSWMQAKPSRTRLAQRALGSSPGKDQDFDAADELFTLWEDYKEARQARSAAPAEDAAPTPAEKPAKPKARAPDLIAPGGGGKAQPDAGGGSDATIYSRAKLTKMQLTDREAYLDPAFQAKLFKAMQEGRVR